MNILIIGQGGREHTITWKIAQSSLVKKIFVAPGNAGIAQENKVSLVPIKVDDIAGLVEFAKQNKIDITVVGPELPLTLGIVDAFEQEGLLCFGPSRSAAQLEASKAFSKAFMQKYHIPTAKSATFDDFSQAIAYLDKVIYPVVIKADGLAAGKGVVIAKDEREASHTIKSFMQENALGDSGKRLVIEEFLEGVELSYMVLTDGKNFVPLASSQDHKRLLENNLGPNTGGMGAISPSIHLTPALEEVIQTEIVLPTLMGMQEEKIPFKGFLYVGIMLVQGKPYVLEYNVRLGDPETEVILFRLKSDLIKHIKNCLAGKLLEDNWEWDSQIGLCTVLAAKGYPENPVKGDMIEGLENMSHYGENVKVFHAGTQQVDQKWYTMGGRVLCISVLGPTIDAARQKCHEVIEKIHFEGMQYRKDIGQNL